MTKELWNNQKNDYYTEQKIEFLSDLYGVSVLEIKRLLKFTNN